ncbi:MAG: hypothetical protein ACPLY7_01845, partial [Microgenomates group bacterium]
MISQDKNEELEVKNLLSGEDVRAIEPVRSGRVEEPALTENSSEKEKKKKGLRWKIILGVIILVLGGSASGFAYAYSVIVSLKPEKAIFEQRIN